MGIGNSSGSTTRSTKLRRTHYPSWGSGTFDPQNDSEGGGTGNSLPLMGIGNLFAGTPDATFRDSSLPLMGIGNGEAAQLFQAAHAFSLPLMGIGNSA